MNNKDTDLIYETYTERYYISLINEELKLLNEFEIPGDQSERSGINLPSFQEVRDRVNKTLAYLPLLGGADQPMDEKNKKDLINLFKIAVDPRSFYTLIQHMVRFIRGNKDNMFSATMREIEEREVAARAEEGIDEKDRGSVLPDLIKWILGQPGGRPPWKD